MFSKKIHLIFQVLHLLEYALLLSGQLKQHISIKSLDIILNITNKLTAYLLVYFSEYSLLSLERIPSGVISYPISFWINQVVHKYTIVELVLILNLLYRRMQHRMSIQPL